jgi:hypothetical protein
MSTEDADQAFAEKLTAKHGRNPKVPTVGDAIAEDRERSAEVDAEFARRLLEPSERKWADRQRRREKSDRQQEGTR